MATIGWNEENELGEEQLDRQHRVLVNLLNGLEVAMSYGDSRPLLGPLLEQFLEHAQTHFETENRLLEQSECPELEIHKTQHQAFLNKALQLHNRLLKQADFLISVETVRLMRDWLYAHIEVQNCPFSAYLKKHT